MWLILAVAGLFLGAISHHDSLWLFGAITGGTLGLLLEQRKEQTRLADALTRLKLLESEVALLRHELDERAQAAASGKTPQRSTAEALSQPTAEVLLPLAPAEADERESERLPARESTRDQIPPAWQAQPDQTMRDDPTPPSPAVLPDWLQRFWQGNPLVKVGIVLLFFGVASGLKLAVQHAVLPLWLRLLLAGFAGAGLLGFGYSRA